MCTLRSGVGMVNMCSLVMVMVVVSMLIDMMMRVLVNTSGGLGEQYALVYSMYSIHYTLLRWRHNIDGTARKLSISMFNLGWLYTVTNSPSPHFKLLLFINIEWEGGHETKQTVLNVIYDTFASHCVFVVLSLEIYTRTLLQIQTS